MKRYLVIPVIVLLLSVCLLTSCKSTPTTSPPSQTTSTTAPSTQTTNQVTGTTAAPTQTKTSPTGTIRVAQQSFGTESFDDSAYASFWDWMMCDPLLSTDAQGNIVGAVAQSYTLSADGKTYTFKIRHDIKFTNGDPMTAKDVLFSLQHYADPNAKNAYSPDIRNSMVSTDIPDDYTLVYNCSKAEPFLTYTFAYIRIFPKNYIDKAGWDAYVKNPIGSGPWKLVNYIPKTEADFDVNMDWWGTLPSFAHVQEKLIPEESTRIAMLKRGDVDLIGDLSADSLVQLRDAGFRLQPISYAGIATYMFQETWLTTGPTSDKRIRQAMSYAINRQELCDTFYRGLANPGGRFFMDPSSWAWDPAWKADPYDPDKAKSLLAEAGYPEKYKGQAIQLVTQAGPFADLFTALKGYWDAVGIKTEIKILDTQSFFGVYFTRNEKTDNPHLGAVVDWIGQGLPCSVYTAVGMYTSTGICSTGNDKMADQLLNKAMSELDPAKAKQYYTEFQNYAYDMWVNTGVCYQPNYWVVGPNLGTFGPESWRSIEEAYKGIAHK